MNCTVCKKDGLVSKVVALSEPLEMLVPDKEVLTEKTTTHRCEECGWPYHKEDKSK